MIAPVAAVAAEPRLPDGVRLREVSDRTDLDRIAAMEEAIWDDERGWLADSLEAERAVDPNALTIVVAEAGDEVRLRSLGSLRGGHGVRDALGRRHAPRLAEPRDLSGVVAYRANLAAREASATCRSMRRIDSRPILERLGFVAVTTTTPYIWSP